MGEYCHKKHRFGSENQTQDHGQGLSLKGIYPMNGNIALFVLWDLAT